MLDGSVTIRRSTPRTAIAARVFAMRWAYSAPSKLRATPVMDRRLAASAASPFAARRPGSGPPGVPRSLSDPGHLVQILHAVPAGEVIQLAEFPPPNSIPLVGEVGDDAPLEPGD